MPHKGDSSCVRAAAGLSTVSRRAGREARRSRRELPRAAGGPCRRGIPALVCTRLPRNAQRATNGRARRRPPEPARRPSPRLCETPRERTTHGLWCGAPVPCGTWCSKTPFNRTPARALRHLVFKNTVQQNAAPAQAVLGPTTRRPPCATTSCSIPPHRPLLGAPRVRRGPARRRRCPALRSGKGSGSRP